MSSTYAQHSQTFEQYDNKSEYLHYSSETNMCDETISDTSPNTKYIYKTKNSLTLSQPKKKNLTQSQTVEILDYLKKIEDKFIFTNPTIHMEMSRLNAINWVIQQQEILNLHCTTLYMAVNLYDRYLEKENICTQISLKIIMGTCLFISIKSEENIFMSLDQFSQIMEVNKDDIVSMEWVIISSLSFQLNQPTLLTFLEGFIEMDDIDKYEEKLALYLAQIAIFDTSLLKLPTSQVAAACLLTSKKLGQIYSQKNKIKWSSQMIQITGYDGNDLIETANRIYQLLMKIQFEKNSLVYNKFTKKNFCQISLHVKLQ